ncbi:sugar phosphate isomerase/epimerase family protein [Arcanobacterium canis]
MWTLTGFADEISKDLTEQIELFNTLGISYVEFRSAWGTKVLDLDPAQLERAKTQLSEAGISVSSIGSDLGKILITEPFEKHFERAAHAMDVAHFFSAPYIRMFSFFIPEGADPAIYREEVMKRTRAMVYLAEKEGITLLHENEKDIYGDTPQRVADLMQTIDSPNYRAIFDPANYVQVGVAPADEAYPVVKDYIEYIHCKDASATEIVDDLNKVLPSGQGDGQFPQLFRALEADGFDGFLSIEPHLGDFNAFGGLCGPDLWTDAYNALVHVLSQMGKDFR